ncbi:MAG: hypothetical protein ACRC2R_09720 [Xenococcaceae cyanobacterium]
MGIYIQSDESAIDLFKEKQKHEYFLTKKWIVIRFAQEQIDKYPDSCCQLIAKVIAECTLNFSYLQKLRRIKKLPLVKIENTSIGSKVLRDRTKK